MTLSTFIIIIAFLSAYIPIILSHAKRVMCENRAVGIVRLLVVAILVVTMLGVGYVFILDHSEEFKEALYHLCSEKTIDYLKTTYEQCFGVNPILFAVQIVGGFLEFFFSSVIVAILSCSLVAIAHKHISNWITQESVKDIENKKATVRLNTVANIYSFNYLPSFIYRIPKQSSPQ